MRLGILGSTRGTNLQAIIEAVQSQTLAAQIAIVLSNKADAAILERASAHHIPVKFVDPKGLTREDFDLEVSKILQTHQVDLIILIGYMRILSADFVRQWQDKIINVHPSLLPKFSGKMDLDVHRSVLNTQEKTTGCTVHYVTAEVDAGPILLQKTCEVLPTDTPETLKYSVQQLEGNALVEAIQVLARQTNSFPSSQEFLFQTVALKSQA